jgi:hypothetical protein
LKTRRWCHIQTNSVSGEGNTKRLGRGAATSLFRRTGSGRKRNRCRALFLQLPKEFDQITLREPSQHLQIPLCRSSGIWVGQREPTCVRDRYCGIGHPFGQRADHIRYRRGWNTLHRHTDSLPTRGHYVYRRRFRSP